MDLRRGAAGKDLRVAGPIEAYMREDHDRLDALRRKGAWWEFRGGLLRHIGLEEKILLPEARRRIGAPLPAAARLREDHGFLATLLVPPFSPEIGAAVERLLVAHNALEEGAAGVYARIDALVGAEAEAIAARLRSAPQTPQRAHQEGPQVRAQVERALQAIAARGL